MPICIAGMHRSGTSMIARMLNLCGLYLGEEGDLHEAQADNPEGFWEHKRFQDVNDKILHLFGGAWDTPPNLPNDWLNDPRLAPIKEEATNLVQEFAGHEHWGWKDPRNSLVLPFWTSLIPDLKVLVSLRNPLDVAASLTKRGYASQTFGITLWTTYETVLEEQLNPNNSLWTHYSSYFAAASEEIARVVEFCGLPASDEQLDAAAATVAGGLRHSETTLFDLMESDAPPETIRLYVDESIKCGPVYHRVMREQAKVLAGVEREKAYREREYKIKDLEAKVQRRDAQQLQLATQIVALERHASHLNMQVQTLAPAAANAAELSNQLAKIQQSSQYIVAQRMARGRIMRGLFKVATKWKRDGFLSLIRAASRRTGGSPQPPAAQPATTDSPAPEPPLKASQQQRVEVGDIYIDNVLDALQLSPKPASQSDLQSLLAKNMSGRRFALAISHDSFQAFTGGIQSLINDEKATLNKDGVAQIHVCPVERIGRLSESTQCLEIIVSVDGKALAVANADDLIEAMKSITGCLSVQIHHVMNWNLQIVDRLLATVENAEKFYWLHDYYSVCESYNLLRNDRAFCNAPPLNSNSCSICKYGPTRAAHMAAFNDFFVRWNMRFLVPSQRGADVWLRAYPEFKDRLQVSPIYRLEPTEEKNNRLEPQQRKIRIAFPGISYEFKGWSHWRKLVDVLQFNSDYELIHLGQKVGEAYDIIYPERYRNIRSNPANPHALPQALEEEQIDIVFYCPIWPETFSLIAYEANGAGCYTLTTEESGNVAAYIKQSEAGKVFPSVDTLIAYLLNPEAVRQDLAENRAHVPVLSKLHYNEEIVRELYLSPNPV
jgi:hypothetical protein